MAKSNILSLPLVTAALVTAKNEDWLDTLKHTHGDSGTPTDLTGIEFRGQVRKSADNPVVWLDLSTRAGTLVNGRTGGQLAIKVRRNALRFVEPGEYVFDIIGEADGATRRLFTGTLIIETGVTR